MQYDIADGGFASQSNFPLCMPDGRIRHGAQHADPILAAIAPLQEPELWVILSFDKSENRTFDGVAHVRRHERVTITPATKFGYGMPIVLKPMTVQR